MDFWQVLRERRSCRTYTDKQVEESKLMSVLEAASLAPSPANRQPWEFIVIKNKKVKQQIFDSVSATREHLFEVSGWRWLGKYRVDFLVQAPLLIAVVGDPEKTGADKFFPGRGEGYQHACAAAVQNMLLAAQAQGLGSLWFSLYDKGELANILGVGSSKDIIALVCLGYSDNTVPQPAKLDIKEKVTFIEEKHLIK